jgi:hypothetical protein
MDQLRAAGKLKTGNFASFERVENTLKVEDHGDAQAYLLSDRLRQASKRLIQRGIIPTEIGHGGWLGAYYRAMANPPTQSEPNRSAQLGREKEHRKGRGR